MRVLSGTIGVRINQFDNLEVQTVETFNNLFTECALTKWEKSDRVIIGPPDFDNSRILVVGKDIVRHYFDNLPREEGDSLWEEKELLDGDFIYE